MGAMDHSGRNVKHVTVVDIVAGTSLLINIALFILLLTGGLVRSLQTFMKQQMEMLAKGQERLEKALQDSLSLARVESGQAAQHLREEVAGHIQTLGQAQTDLVRTATLDQAKLIQNLREFEESTLKHMAAADKERFDTFSRQTDDGLAQQNRHLSALIGEMALQQKNLLDSFMKQLAELTQMNATKLEQIRTTVEQQLTALQKDNSEKLELMRATVDEKLHQTLEQRLGESFKLVSERLEQVQKGLGEMQSLASGVGDLKKVLTNVKTRGTLGEIQLDNILEQILTPDQYESAAIVRRGSQERVDFAVRLPGRDDAGDVVLLPIDAKFPLEDYQRLVEAQESADLGQAQEAAKFLETRIRAEARSISEKYVNPPTTTDFAILFVPIEGLFAEILRRPGLWEGIQRDYHVIVTGPTTITALLNSLQMGFRTLAIQKRSSEVWKLLGAVKTEFGKFGEVLEKTQKKLQEASNTIDSATVRTRAIERQLRTVQALPVEESQPLLEALEGSVGER